MISFYLLNHKSPSKGLRGRLSNLKGDLKNSKICTVIIPYSSRNFTQIRNIPLLKPYVRCSTPLISTIEKSTQVSDYLGFSLFYATFLPMYFSYLRQTYYIRHAFTVFATPRNTRFGTRKKTLVGLLSVDVNCLSAIP